MNKYKLREFNISSTMKDCGTTPSTLDIGERTESSPPLGWQERGVPEGGPASSAGKDEGQIRNIAKNRYIVVFVTSSSALEAKKMSRAVLGKKLAACASMLKGLDSSYWWRGKIEHSREVLIIMKTTQSLFNKLAAEIKKNHSYEVPEIIALPIIAGSADYLKWIDESVSGAKNERSAILGAKR